MTANEQTYCSACHLVIGLQRHAIFKKPGAKGKPAREYLYFHNRASDDCWGKHLRLLMQKYNGKMK
ncbi:MAG TPA: hypothetical protein VEU62_12595 [Bryobacterales bacterium]|nr:hypothetical protein [Bryobacterales bacterium]